MFRIELAGETFNNCDDIKGFVRRWRWSLFEYLPKGIVPRRCLPPENDIFSPLIEKMNQVLGLLNDEEKDLLAGLIRLQNQLRSFDRKRYESLDENKKVAYALRFGKQCAAAFDVLVDGSMKLFDLRNRMLYYYPHVIGKDGKRKEWNLECSPMQMRDPGYNDNHEASPEQLDCKGDQKLFIESAQIGRPAVLLTEIAGTLYRCEILRGLVFRKTTVKVHEREPDAVKDLLDGKSMTCNYEDSCFDTQLISTVALGIEACEGPLKDALLLLSDAVADKHPNSITEKINFRLNEDVFHKKILIIYDDQQQTEFLRVILARAALYAVHIVKNAEAGLAYTRGNSPELIILTQLPQ